MPRRSAISFTDAFVRSKAVPQGGRRTSYSDRETPGLELRVSESGVKSWAFRYRDAAGRTRRFKIGHYPAIGLKHAREQVAEAKRTISRGSDPILEKAQAIAEARAKRVNTVGDLFDEYLSHAARRNRASTIAVDRQRAETHVLPRFRRLPLEQLRRSDVRALIKELGDQGKGVTANRVAALIGRVYRFARRELDIEAFNPAEGLQSTYAERSKDRVLDHDELKALLKALEERENAPTSLSAGMALCLQLCVFTLQRAGEVAGIRRDEIQRDERLWVLPAERSKNKREHLVPLSDVAMDIIDKAERLAGDNAFLFPSPRRGPEETEKPITRHAVTRAMARLMDSLKLKRAGPHDLRRTGATWITSERIGLPRFYVSHVLGHISETGGVTSVYDRNSYLREKREALDRLAGCLSALNKD